MKTIIAASALLVITGCNAVARNCNIENHEYKEGNFVVKVSRYTRAVESDRAILIFPPTGGSNVIDRSYARRLCYAGFDVYILNGWTGQDEESDDLELHQKLYTRAMKAAELTLSHVKSPYVGMLGTSVGATFAAVAGGTFDRIDAYWLILGGISIPQVIVNSDQKEMVELKKRRFEKYGFKNDHEYLENLDTAFSIDPTRLPKKFEGKDIGMIVATEDKTVPTFTQKNLEILWKPKTLLHISTSHFWGILRSWMFHSRTMVSFFERSAEARTKH